MAQRSKPNFGVGINWAHPLARGLVDFRPLNDLAGLVARDITGLGVAAPAESGGSLIWTREGLDASGSGNFARIPSIALADVETVTVAVAFKTSDAFTSGSDSTLIEHWSGGSAYPYVLRVGAAGAGHTAGAPYLAAYDGTNNPSAVGAASNDGRWHIVVGVRRKGSTLKVFLDANTLVSSTDTTSGSTSNAQDIGIGGRPGTTALNFPGIIGWTAIWARGLDDVEAYNVASNGPWAMIARKPLLYKSAGGGPISATCTATLTFGVSATGSVNINATAAPSLALGVAATGAVQVKAAAAPALQFGVSATGTLTNNATASPVLQFAVSSAAAVNINATASPSLALGVVATGAVAVQATGTATLNFSASATGTTSAGVHADCTATLILSASASAALSDNAVVSAALNLQATGSAGVQNNAQAVAALVFGAQGTAQALIQASSAATFTLQASATSAVTVRATGSAVLSFVATGTGTVVSLGAPVPLKSTRVFAGPLIRVTRVYAGPLVRVTRVETFPS